MQHRELAVLALHRLATDRSKRGGWQRARCDTENLVGPTGHDPRLVRGQCCKALSCHVRSRLPQRVGDISDVDVSSDLKLGSGETRERRGEDHISRVGRQGPGGMGRLVLTATTPAL